MKHSASYHRLAGIPLMSGPPIRPPLNRRIQAAFWRALFAGWTRLRIKDGRTMPSHLAHLPR